MQALLPQGIPKDLLPFAGVVQQYIFHYMRTCPDAPNHKRAGKKDNALS
jgi:N-glycosylase/DNA lyase